MDFSGIVRVYRGALVPGRIKLQPEFVAFKASGSDDILRVDKGTVTSAQWSRAARGYMLKLLTATNVYKFCGFQESDRTKLSDYVMKCFETPLEEVELCVRGMNWGEVEFQGPLLRFMADKKPAFEITLNDVANVTTGKNEVTLQFHQNDSAPVSLMEMRLHIPSANDGEEDTLQSIKDKILAKADIMEATGDAIASFGEVHCLTPRGRYTIKAYPTFLEMHGKTFDYKIPYKTVLQLILLPHNDQRSMFFVLGLDPPIRQGQTMYPFIILSFMSDEDVDITLTLTEEEIAGYDGKLTKEMSGPIYEVFSRLIRALVGKKIAVPGKFKSHSGLSAVSCGHKSNTGFLYPMDKGLIFVHKPTVYVKYEQVACVNFARVSGGGGASRSFDFEVDLKNGNGYTFSSIMKDDYGRLFDFITAKNIKVKNKGVKQVSYDDGGGASDSESGHDVYLERVKAEGQERDSEDEDSDFVAHGSGSDDALEYDESAEDSDEDKPVEEKPRSSKPNKSSSAGAKRSKPSSENGKSSKKKKAKKDPNAPKKPLSAYMLWLQETRPSLKKKYPGVSIIELSKKAGEAWKGITDKAKWEAEARRAKTRYHEQMKEYQKTGKVSGDTSSSKKSSTKSPAKSKKPVKSTPSSDKKFKSDEFIESSNEEDEEEEDEGEATASSSNKRSRRKDDSELVELSEGSGHDESEAEMSGSDEDEDEDD